MATATPAAANTVKFTGAVGYSRMVTFVVLNAAGIQNSSPTPTGSLRLELWATPAPFAGSFASGYQVASYGIAALGAGASVGSINSGLIAWTNPPAGSYYLTFVLTESGVARDWLTFPDKIVGSGTAPPPSDTTAPTVSIASPTGGNVSGTVIVTANASDNVAVSRVDFYVNGALAGSDSASPYQYSWNTAALANGAATLRAVAFDAAGNQGSSSTVTVNVANTVAIPPPPPPPTGDTTAPSVGITWPTWGNVSGTVTITTTASDNVGVTRVDFYVNGKLLGSDSSSPFTYAWNTTATPNGVTMLRAVAFDAAGNSKASGDVQVQVSNTTSTPPPTGDTTAPTASIASPAGGSSVSGTVTVTANASDNVGVSRVDFYVNGALVGSDSTSPYQYAWNTASVANGSATLKAVAVDAAGNSGQSANVVVTVANTTAPVGGDKTPPTVGITWPTWGNQSGLVTITANATDNVGVTRVDFYVDSALVGTDTTAPYSYAWNTTAFPNGIKQLYAVAFDAAGNSTRYGPVQVQVLNPVTKAQQLAVEYYNPELDHYFTTAASTEITDLDSGKFKGWTRTGYSALVFKPGTSEGNPVCRFYMPPSHGDSHFYSASPGECSDVAGRFPDFSYESTEVFRVATPDPATGQCADGTVPMYRLWNNRPDSNHRYTADRNVKSAMVAKGYIAEGYGPDSVIMCSAQ